MANSDKNIVIQPSIGSTVDQPSITFTGAGNSSITLKVLDDAEGTLSFEGYEGQVFAINNNLSSGVIYSVNDISGFPIIDADASGNVRLSVYSGNVGVGTTLATQKLDVNGTVKATTFSGSLTGTATTATTATNATNITLADESSDTTCFPIFATDATGNQAPKTDSSALTYNASTGALSATSFVGNVTGNLTGTATTATNITLADESSDTTCFPIFATDATGDQAPKTDSSALTYNASTGALSATSFVGSLTGNADTASTATNITLADESSDTTCFPLFATDATGNQAPKTDSSALTYNASTGTLNATAFSGDGSALTNLPASPSSGEFYTGITSSIQIKPLSYETTVHTFPSTAGRQYVIESISVANIDTSVGVGTTVNIIASIEDATAAEQTYIAYNVPIVNGGLIELLKNPIVAGPSDVIKMWTTNSGYIGTFNAVDVYMNYTNLESTEYKKVYAANTTLNATGETDIYTSSTYPTVFESIHFANRTDSGDYPISVTITNGTTTTYLAKDLVIPRYSTVDILDRHKRIETDAVIAVSIAQTGSIDVILAGKQITS